MLVICLLLELKDTLRLQPVSDWPQLAQNLQKAKVSIRARRPIMGKRSKSLVHLTARIAPLALALSFILVACSLAS